MILGAGIYQVPLIKKAKEMGLETIVCSVPGRYPGIACADRFYPLDTTDAESILALAKELAIDGITTSGTDVAVASIGRVCDAMGLSGIPYEAALRVTDKYRMKETFAKAGVSTARHIRVSTLNEAEAQAEALGYPIVIKPVDSSGSRGVRRLDGPDELPGAFAEAMRRSRKDYLLLETFIDAAEIGVDAFVGDGDFLAFLPHTKYTCTTADGITIPAGHCFPFIGSEALLKELRTQMLLAARALGLKNCPLNADVFVSGERVWIIEIGGRTGATCIPELISINQGYDWYENLIRCALGEHPTFAPRADQPCMSRLLFSPVNGAIRAVDEAGLDRLRRDIMRRTASASSAENAFPNTVQIDQSGQSPDMPCNVIQIDYPVGAPFDAVQNATDRIGHIIVPTDDPRLLDEYVRRVCACIELEQGNLAALLDKKPLRIKYA